MVVTALLHRPFGSRPMRRIPSKGARIEDDFFIFAGASICWLMAVGADATGLV